MLTNNNKYDKTQAWMEKYRPSTLDDVYSQESNVKSLRNYLKYGTLPHLLFCGPPGTGKTSVILCIAKEMFGDFADYKVLRLNASSDRGIETVRTKVKEFISNDVGYMLPEKIRNYPKIVILDEADSMTYDAQGILRQMVEKYSTHNRFCLICNNKDAINLALQSRCTKFNFAPASRSGMLQRLKVIAKAEGIKYEKGTLEALIDNANGDMRKVINMLQTITQNYNETLTLTHENIRILIGATCDDDLSYIYNTIMKCKKIEKTTKIIMNFITSRVINLGSLLEAMKNKIIYSDMELENKIKLVNVLLDMEEFEAINVDLKIIIRYLISHMYSINNV